MGNRGKAVLGLFWGAVISRKELDPHRVGVWGYYSMAGGPIKPFVFVMARPSQHDLYNQADN